MAPTLGEVWRSDIHNLTRITDNANKDIFDRTLVGNIMCNFKYMQNTNDLTSHFIIVYYDLMSYFYTLTKLLLLVQMI